MRAATAMCGNVADAEDLVQETCLRVLAKPRRVNPDAEVAYLLGALRNVFLNDLRTRSRRPRTVGVTSELWSTRPGPEDVAETREVFAAIAELPDEMRDALVAVDVAGLSYAEAGKLLDVKEATIATRVFRARDRVAQRLQ